MRKIISIALTLNFVLAACGNNQNKTEAVPTKPSNTDDQTNLHSSWNNEALQVRCYTQIDKTRTYLDPVGLLSKDGKQFNPSTYAVVKLKNNDSVSIKVFFEDFDDKQDVIVKPKQFSVELYTILFPDPNKPNEFVEGKGSSRHPFERNLKTRSAWPDFNYEVGCEVESLE